ncbi:hypothetical protein [Gimesia sp.]|uniref:hypothetical protein n=1 Tax=Gimesia sp. TaxID=2024833 RepID=UPI000C3C90A6|nr:hypothetical protein [Gimesia sp.]MAX35279.1 hypothetical protein [Gimesia sp.]HAH48065.1 hypothetical protein [Planctomycetaceae bacterium]|tara:strand:+ start:1880 stop:2314 length:435 start_codon:yes stop_codon:yes gene_type:complete
MSQSGAVENIDDDDILMRRIQPDEDMVAKRKEGGLRASSFAMQTRRGEDYLSCSLLRITSPKELLELIPAGGKSNDRWRISIFRASDARNNGYEIIHDPTDEDYGHSIVTGQNGEPMPNHKFKEIARHSRILTVEEIENPNLIT